MWLHIVIFVILLLLTVCSTLGWIHVENIGTAKGRKMFLVVALAGNITGGLLTWTKGGGQVFEDGYELKKEENAYEEKLYHLLPDLSVPLFVQFKRIKQASDRK